MEEPPPPATTAVDAGETETESTPDAPLRTFDGRSRPGELAVSYDITPLAVAQHTSTPYSLATSRHFRYLLTGCSDGKIFKWDFYAIMNAVGSLPQNQRSAYVDTVTRSGGPVSQYFNEDTDPDAAASAADGHVQGAGAEQEHEAPAEHTVDASPVYALAMHSEALWALSGTRSGNINLFTVRHDEGTVVHTLRRHTRATSALALSTDEQSVLSGSWDTLIHDWDLNTGSVRNTFSTHNSHVSCIRRHPHDANLFLSTAANGMTLVWDSRDSTTPAMRLAMPDKTPPWAMAACWNPQGARIMVGRRNNSADIYSVTGGSLERTLSLPRNSGAVSTLYAMPNGRHLLLGSTDIVRLWDLQHGEDVDNAVNGNSDTPPGRKASVVPFVIIPGHHGGVLSNLVVDEECRFMITTSGNRGYDGPETSQCLLYKIQST
ncbi:Transcription factor spt8 [Sorochytrium milnesiophthora]